MTTNGKFSSASPAGAIGVVLDRLADVKVEGDTWRALCPVHNGHSLIIARGEQHPVVMDCKSGCDVKEIVAALDLAMADLMSPNGTHPVADRSTERRISASIGFQGAARHILLACLDPTDESGARRVLAVVKSNLAEYPAPLSYTIESTFVSDHDDDEITTSRIRWGEELPGLDPRSLLAPPNAKAEPERLEDAAAFLREAFKEEEVRPSDDVVKEAAHQGMAKTTLRRAMKDLGFPRSYKLGFGKDGVWYQRRPEGFGA